MQPKYAGSVIGGVIALLVITLHFSKKFVETSQNVFFIVFELIVFAVIGGYLGELLGEKELKSTKKEKKEEKK